MLPETLIQAAGKALVDHRIYTIQPRKMGEFIEVFDRLAMPLLLETLGHPLGFWTSLVGPQNQFVHLWGYDSLADYEQRCRAPIDARHRGVGSHPALPGRPPDATDGTEHQQHLAQ